MSGAHAVGLASIGGFGSVELVVLVVVASVYAVVPAGLVYLAISREGDEIEGETESTSNGDVSEREDETAAGSG
jgi:hypothetical protein